MRGHDPTWEPDPNMYVFFDYRKISCFTVIVGKK